MVKVIKMEVWRRLGAVSEGELVGQIKSGWSLTKDNAIR